MPHLKNFLKVCAQSFFATVVLIVILEAGLGVLGVAAGSSTFVERIVLSENLKTHKAPDEYRIFTYGESSMHGAHYAPVSSPAIWLREYLKDFLPEKNIRVVNFARLGQGPFFIRETFQETLQYKPDLAVFYMGHNIFLKASTKRFTDEKYNSFKCVVRRLIRKSRLFSFVYRQVIRTRLQSESKEEMEDSMEFRDIETYAPARVGQEEDQRGTAYFLDNLNFFRESVEDISVLGQSRKIPIVFFNPVCNLKDFAPNSSAHLEPLAAEEQSEWETLFEEAKAAERNNQRELALEKYLEAYKIGSTFAELSFRLGRLYFERGDLVLARTFFEEARDNDTLIRRAPKEVSEILEENAEKSGVFLLDTEKALVSEVPGGILGEPVIEDNVHFSIKAQSLIALELARTFAENNWISPLGDWRFENQRPFEKIQNQIGVNEDLLFSADVKIASYMGHRFGERLAAAQRAVARKPEHPKSLRHLAWTYWLMGDVPKSLEVYRRLEQVSPQDLENVFNNRPEIKEAFQEAVKSEAGIA